MFTMQNINRARAMRTEPTYSEKRLWDRLRNRRLAGLKFRRQVPVEGFIADFLCVEARLIVEADGPSHEDSLYDLERDGKLGRAGWRVMRFRNNEIANDIEAVLLRVRRAAGRPEE